jgi:hypothetical protein
MILREKGGEPLMIKTWTKNVTALVLACSFLAPAAAAAKEAPAKYKKVTGEVVSIGQDSISIKSRTKGTMKLAITKDTDVVGQPVKTGDKATVNYRQDKDGNTATRIARPDEDKKAGRSPASGPSPAAKPH